MPISDSQSLVDLLRLAVREDYEKLAAHFHLPSRPGRTWRPR